MKNILSIDLESWIYYHDCTLGRPMGGQGSEAKKARDAGYILVATRALLDLLDQHGQKATFFVLGEVFDWYPGAVEEIALRGHEVGYHTHNHPLRVTADVLEREIEQSQAFLDLFRPIGFRAPQIYLTQDSLPILRDAGFRYSSSTYGEHEIHTLEGIEEIPVSVYRFRGSDQASFEFPRSLTLSLLSHSLPFGSGLMLGLLGAKTSSFIRRANEKGHPAILFLHPWQIYRPKVVDGIGFKIRALLHSPLSMPYTFTILRALETLLERHEFVSFQEYYFGRWAVTENVHGQQAILG
jgi:peptidoglycan/xylan/chitin deacetylase (PgdA/CDA1 family)